MQIIYYVIENDVCFISENLTPAELKKVKNKQRKAKKKAEMEQQVGVRPSTTPRINSTQETSNIYKLIYINDMIFFIFMSGRRCNC